MDDIANGYSAGAWRAVTRPGRIHGLQKSAPQGECSRSINLLFEEGEELGFADAFLLHRVALAWVNVPSFSTVSKSMVTHHGVPASS